MAAQQNPDGSWGTGYQVAKTAFAVLKFETHAIQNCTDPLDPSYLYHAQVRNGLDYIFANAHTLAISTQPAGDPDTDGDGLGVYFVSPFVAVRTYETGVVMMAIAASTHPEMVVSVPGSVVNGWTYKDVLQDAVDYLAFGQNDAGLQRGGWGYSQNDGWSDNSNTGYAVRGLAYAEAYSIDGKTGFACTIPAFVRSELNLWITYVQNPVDGDPNDGGSGYTNPMEWVNILKTGNLLFEMAFYGDTSATQRVQDAIDYLVRHWNDANDDPGWKGPAGGVASYQAMYTTMKGLEILDIDMIDGISWFDEFSDVLVAQQNPDGSWPTCMWDDGQLILSTEWALLTLQKAPPPPPPEDLELYPREVVDLIDPTGTQWHELHPYKSRYFKLTGWEPSIVLSPGDQIDMYSVETSSFEVDEVTIDLVVRDAEETLHWLDYKCGYWTFKKDVWKNPVSSKWNEIKPDQGLCWHLTSWEDNGDGKLSPCDYIEMTLTYPFGPGGMVFHVENVTVTLKLTTKEYPRFVVMIGSAPAHAAPSGPTVLPGYPAHGYGGDPGRDEIMFTSDDLDYAPVINKIASEGITVFTVDYAYLIDPDAYTSFDYIASQTGGIHYDGGSAWDVSIANEIGARIGTSLGDVVFSCDITGDMGMFLADVKTKAKAIIDALSTLDVGFGVGTHVDYPDSYASYGYSNQYGFSPDYAWSMDTDLTDAATAKSTIDSAIVFGYSGADVAEDYVRALYECQYFSWRAKESYLEFMGTLDEFQLNDHIHNPETTMWHEIWPCWGQIWTLTSWENSLKLGPSDQIVLTLKDPETHEPIPGTEAEYYVDKLTVAMNLTSTLDDSEHIVKFEGSLEQFKKYHWIDPLSTQWHEVNPVYYRQWHILSWSDNGNGVLDYCDYIKMIDKETGWVEEFHVESLSTDIIVTLKVHDVAVIDVTPYKTVVCQELTIRINATVENQGDFTETNIAVTVKANDTVVDTKTIPGLGPSEQTTLTFTWNASGFAKGNYTISAVATPVPDETDTADNTFVDGTVIVSYPGDINGPGGVPDGLVDIDDVIFVAIRFGSVPGWPNWDPLADLTDDDLVDIDDVMIPALRFGEIDP